MAVAPLESSSTPPDATSTDTTRPAGDSMEEFDPQSTRKRPRLDSGSGVCQNLPAPNDTTPPLPSEPAAPDAPATAAQEAPEPRPASRMTINVKSPTTATASGRPPVPQQNPPDEPGPDTSASAQASDEQPTNVVSLSSSPAQSPEIEVAELEDMDQDPNTTNWKSLGEAMRDPAMPDVVQLRERADFLDSFPTIDSEREPRENLQEMCVVIEKGAEHETIVFNAVRQWMNEVANNLDVLTLDLFMDARYFWEEVPLLAECLLRRTEEFQENNHLDFWRCLEEFLVDYSRLAFHLISLDTLRLRQLVDETHLQGLYLLSRSYLSSLGFSLAMDKVPYYSAMQARYGHELVNLVAHLNDRIMAAPIDGPQCLFEFTSSITELISRWPQLSSPLHHALRVAEHLAESSNNHNGFTADNNTLEPPEHQPAIDTIYSLVRSVDEVYQTHITKKSPWITNETSPGVFRYLSHTYLALCNQSASIASRIVNDQPLSIPDDIPTNCIPIAVFYAWRFGVLKKHVMEGRMELRVLGIDAMQTDFVTMYNQYIRRDIAAGLREPIVLFMVKVLRESRIVEYVLGIDSHPQLISRSHNIVGFLVVTEAYTDDDTDTIWATVTESPDPWTVSEVLAMLVKTFSLHGPSFSGLLYLCDKLLELPLNRFDSRMVDFCDQMFSYLRDRNSRQDSLDSPHVDVEPLSLCVRLIRESAATEDLAVGLKAHLQEFAAAHLSSFMNVGLDDIDKMDIYERCVQDIAERNQFSVGSIQALNALLNNQDSQEIRKLAMEFNLTHLTVSEIAEVVEGKHIDFTDSFSRNGFVSRVHMLRQIIEGVPDSITPELGDMLWKKVFMSRSLPYPGRRALWDMLCGITWSTMIENSFIDRCIQHYLPALSPVDYTTEVLSFAKQSITYEIRFNPPSLVGEDEVISIPGLDRIWKFILTAPPNSIEADATAFAIEGYLDHSIIHRSPRSAVEATHMALVDRCVDQLKSAASKLKSRSDHSTNGDGNAMAVETPQAGVLADELKFSRSLFFLRTFLQALRARPQYSPPQNSPPNLPLQPVKGELVDIRYQAFDGGSSSKVRSLRVGDLSTAAELVDSLIKVTGFPKIMIIFSGQRVNLLENPNQALRDLKLSSGLLLVRRDPSCRATAGRKFQPLTSVDNEVLKHFDDLYDLLNLDDHSAREIYEFLVVFPPQEKVMNLVRSTDENDESLFPMAKPYILLYSVYALSESLRQESLEPTPSESLVIHSVETLVAALTRRDFSETLATPSNNVIFASSLVECLYNAIVVKAPVSLDASLIPDSANLLTQLLRLLEIGQSQPPVQLLEVPIHKLVTYAFAVLIEGSIRDSGFWAVIKQQVKFDKLLFSLLVQERRQHLRRGIADKIALICSSSKHLKKPKLPASQEYEAREAALSENPARVDILATIWDAFVNTFGRALEYPAQSQEFFEIALVVFTSVAEKSPRDMILSDYLKQWSSVMLNHRTSEFVGREPVDHLIFGFSRLIKSCLEIAASSDITLDTFDLIESLFDTYLFPDLSMESDEPIIPLIPVMHSQTRQELYSIVSMLSKYDDNYVRLVMRLEDIIPQDHTYQLPWSYDRTKLIRSPEGYAGLRNLSNTCYLNSLLSQLFMNVGFREFMLKLNLTDPAATQRLLDETKKVFGYMQESWLKGVDPQGFVDTIRTYDNEPVDVTVQMDVDEFYNLLFDRWEAQISNPEDREKFRTFYGGQLVQQIKSKECDHISERLEPFSAIQCDIKGKASLEESLQAYVEGEIMQGDNKYSCTSCGRHVDAVKRACLKDVPDNLIFHLKRFDFDMVTMTRSKINDEFQFPERIDMTPYTVDYLSDSNQDAQQDVFELVGVLVHSGTAESGHYYSYIRERPAANGRGTWVEFNDSDVSRFDPARIAEQCFGGYSESMHSASVPQVRFNKVWNAYMLFYQRVSSVESAKSTYNAAENHFPVRVPLPVSLANHIVMENELFVRTYCLLDPFYTLFVRYLSQQLTEEKLAKCQQKNKVQKHMIVIALDTVEQLISRTKDATGFEVMLAEIYRIINELPKGPRRVTQWSEERPAGIPHLLKSIHPQVRAGTVRLLAHTLSRFQELSTQAEDGSIEKERWNAFYLDGLEYITATLDGMWLTLHAVSRSWDDYFELLCALASFGSQEAGIVLDHGFLLKCLEMVWIDYDDGKRLKRQYFNYCKLLEKGRKFSHVKLMDLMSILLARIDFTVRPVSEDERQPLSNGKFSLTLAESDLIRPLNSNGGLICLKKILSHNNSPQACRNIFALLMDAEPGAGLMDPIFQVLEDGLRVAPAERCAPFLDAALILCRKGPDEDRIMTIIDFVAKGVDTINDSGGKEHVAFFTQLLVSRNERLGLDEAWFTSQVVEMIPDWVPALLMYPDRAVRNMTMELLRQMLFDEETSAAGEEWQTRCATVAKDLVSTSVDKLRKTYLATTGISVEAEALEVIRTVIDHCLTTYFGESEEDQQIVTQAQAVVAAIGEMAVEIPEELPSESDVPSPEEWDDNSMIASDSEMAMAGTP